MARPDIRLSQPTVDMSYPGTERSTSDHVRFVIQAYFNHPCLHSYNRMRDWPEYYNPHTEKFESLLAGFIGDTYDPGEILISSQAQRIQIIQRFQEDSDISRWEGLVVSRDRDGIFQGEMVNRYYQHSRGGEAVLLPKPVVRLPLKPQQILDEAMTLYDSFRIRYDLVT